MDHNHYNNNQSSDSFYSYKGSADQSGGDKSTGAYGSHPYQQSTGYQQNGTYGQGGAYQQSAGYQQNGTYGQGGAYQKNTAYQTGSGYGSQGNSGMYAQAAGKKDKEKGERRPGGFGVKLAKCTALALVFGLVSGTAFEGVRLASGQMFGDGGNASNTPGSVLTQSGSGGKIEATPTSTTYLATGVSDIVDAVMPSIVAITNVSEAEYPSFWGNQTYESTSAGSGIIVSQDDTYLYIVTNNHVVNGATTLTVTFSDDSTVSAEVKGTDASTDLAVLRVQRESIEEETTGKIKVATLGSSDDLRVGDQSIAIGNALGYGQSVTTGVISALNREVAVSDPRSNTNYVAELIQTEAAINPGNSGGALLNGAGEVIGINSVKYSDTKVEGIGYAIPISTAMPIVEDLISKEKVDESNRAYLGIAGVDVTPDVANTYNMPQGVSVVQVTAGSAAEQAGIHKGDIITAIDGKAISRMEELSMRLQYYKAGETVELTLQRAENGEYAEQTLSVTLGKKN